MDEQKVRNKKKFWGKPVKSEKQTGRELARILLSGGLTLLLAALIIAGGFALPGFIYPYIDSYNNDFVHLTKPTESTALASLPNEEFPSFPWDTYDELRLRNLSEDEISKLNASRAADFLISIMRDYGMQLTQDTSFYKNALLRNFRCLEPQAPGGPRFFVLYSEDLNGDGTADLRSAFDYDGKLISLIFLSGAWESLQLAAPIDVMHAGSGTTDQSETSGTTQGVNDSSSFAENPAENQGETTGQNPTENNVATSPSSNLPQPIGEDGPIWAFSYAVSREAYLFDQMNVFSAFRQLDFHYARRYGYEFNNRLPNPLTEREVLPEDPIEDPIRTPDHIHTNEYQYNIYRLANGAQLILYINPSNQNCVGFNLQQYNPSTAQG